MTIALELEDEIVARIDERVGADHREHYVAQLVREALPVSRALTEEETHQLHEELQRTGSRFRPAFIQGEPLSHTIMRDRGSL